MEDKITIIGGGNIGLSIAEGLVKSNTIKPSNITVTNLKEKIHLLDKIKQKEVNVSSDNKLAVKNSNIIFLTIQPNHIDDILNDIKDELTKEKIIISIVAGVDTKYILSKIEKDIIIFRAMPNTAISIQQSMTCLSSSNASEEQKEKVLSFFNHLGKTVLIEEELMGAATVLAACGIAYALRYIRAASQGGTEIGFDAELSQLITSQTVKGATSLLLEKGYHPEREIDKVTTPRGYTIAGLNEMEFQGFSSALIKGITTSYKKMNNKE